MPTENTLDRKEKIMYEWEKVKVGDIGKVITGKTPKTYNSEYYGGNIPFLTPSDDMSVKYVRRTNKYITELGRLSVKNATLPANAICVSCIGSDLGKVVITTQETVTNQQINSIVVDTDKFDIDFVYYSMLELGKVLNFHSKTSTAVPIVNKSSFSQYEIDCPKLNTQKRIGAILSSIDKKIEENNQINNNLLQQALAVYKAWFCDYVLSDGVLPESWHITTIDALSSLVTRGIAPKYDDSSNQIVLNQKCIRDHTIDVSLARRHLQKRINEKWISKGDLLINSTGTGTLGRVAQVWFDTNNMTVDSHVTIVRPKAPILQSYIGFWGFSHESEIEAQHTGSTGQTELPRDRVKALELLLPDEDTLIKFNGLVIPMTDIVVSNQKENARLSQLRDTLLPKLMSGEFDVSTIEI